MKEEIMRICLNTLEENGIGILASGKNGVHAWDGDKSFVLETCNGFFKVSVSPTSDPAETPEHASEGAPICTVSRWGEDDYSCEWISLPQTAADLLFKITEPYCDCSVRGNAKDIANEVKDLLKQSKKAAN
jgi:hypothetical protein